MKRFAAGLAAFATVLSAHGYADSPPLPPPSPVLASFDGGSIAVANKALVLRATYVDPAVRERMLHKLVDYALLTQEAVRRGYERSDRVRVAMLIELTNQVEARVAASVDPMAIPEAELRAHYDENRAKFAIAPLRRATYVRAPTRAEAAALAARARSMPISDFRDLAIGRVRAKAGGELPYVDAEGRPDGVVGRPLVDAELVKHVFAVDALGKVSEPFEHEGAFVVLRITGRTEGAGNRFEDAVMKVREVVVQERVKQAQAALEQRLHAEHAVEVHPELLDAVMLDPAPAADIPAGFPAAPPDPRAPTVVVEPDDA